MARAMTMVVELYEPVEKTLARRLSWLKYSQAEGKHIAVVEGHTFRIFPGVFSPKYFESTHVLCSLLKLKPGGSLLEIGTGCGAIAIIAAVRGSQPVVGTDISKKAVANATENVKAHGVADCVSIIQANLFDGLPQDQRFDTIFWNAPWVFAGVSFKPSELERSVCDPGYLNILRYFRDAMSWLEPDGRLMLGFGSFGNESRMLELASKYCWIKTNQTAVKSPHDDSTYYTLFEFKKFTTTSETN